MKNKRIEAMTISAIFIAIIAIMSFVPYVGYISIPGTPISICTIHIIVILAALLFGWKQGLVAGFTFGILSLVKAACMPVAVSDVLFVNPMVSVLPRVLFGVISGLIFDYLKRIRHVSIRTISYVIGAIFCTALHTTLVLAALWLFNRESFSDPFLLIIGCLIAVNGAIEMISAGIIVPLLAKPIGKVRKQYDPYSQLPYKTPISVEVIFFIIVIFVFALLSFKYMTLRGLLPIAFIVIYLVVKAIRKKKIKHE